MSRLLICRRCGIAEARSGNRTRYCKACACQGGPRSPRSKEIDAKCGHLYVLHTASGWLKLGMSTNVESRIRTLGYTSGEVFIDRSLVPAPNFLYYREGWMLRKMEREFPNCSGREWFKGANFDRAVELAMQAATLKPECFFAENAVRQLRADFTIGNTTEKAAS